MSSLLKNKIFKNASWIIACKIVQAVLNLIVTMLSARYLGPSGYGLINYAASVVAFATPIMQLGLNSVLVQEIVNAPEKEGEALGTSLIMSFCTSFLTIAGVVSFVAIANHGEKETIIVCALYSILLIFQSLELIQYWFQAKLKSKYPSIVMLVAYVVMSAYKIFLLVTGKNIYWFALSQAIDFLIISVLLLIIYQKIGTQKLTISWERAKSIFSKSKYYIVSSLMVTIFAQTDRIMLKLMIGDEATGYYSAAVACAGMTGFIFSAIIDSARPSIFESKNCNIESFEKNVSRLYSVVIYFALLQCVFITILAKPIVHILYGKEYEPSINALRLIVWYTTFSYIGSVRNIWILAEGKQKVLWILNLSGALLNVVLNYFLIPILGIMGAALASLITQIFTNVIMGFIIKPIRRNNKLMFQALNPKCVIELMRKVKR
jgi:polysaccharide biosynthesis protein